MIDARKVRFEHKDLQVIVRSSMADRLLDAFAIEQGHVGVLFEDGRYVETLPPGKYAFWKNMAKVVVVPVDLRETMLDVGGQEIMTADKVTLRLNAVATYRVADAHKALSAADDVRQALYREAQLALRAVIGGRELDQFLADKDAVAKELEVIVRQRVAALGLEIVSVGIRDVILPGDMKDLMNKVTEAKKAAEANLIVRREETAAMRSQANTAKLLEGKMLREYCAEVGEDHGMILRDDQQGDVNERKQSRKSRQLCRQVAEALDWVLSGDSHDELLQSLRVADVQPSPYSSRLLVTVITDLPAEEADRQSILDRLQEHAGRLRSEVAALINRRKAPTLVFQVMGGSTQGSTMPN